MRDLFFPANAIVNRPSRTIEEARRINPSQARIRQGCAERQGRDGRTRGKYRERSSYHHGATQPKGLYTGLVG